MKSTIDLRFPLAVWHKLRLVFGLWTAVALLAGLVGCSDGGLPSAAQLTGQVGGSGGSQAQMSFYAASRFLEQSSMGPTPSEVNQLRSLGAQAWLTAQLALPATQLTTPDMYINYELNQDRALEQRAFNYHKAKVNGALISGPDQLRNRVAWVLTNYLVVRALPYGATEYFNTLMQHALGSYADLLKAVTLSPAMGWFLDNARNSRYQLNENYGRELMQLFSVGLVKLNLDGSPQRGANGSPLETYTQDDVIAITRALTGWDNAEGNIQRPGSNFANFAKPMVAAWVDKHDQGIKQVLGILIPAGQTAEQDLDSVIQILVNHPNTAPFVSLRLIQGLTASNPSPAYLQRVARVFVSSKGQLAQVVQAVLLDPEARAGEVLGNSSPGFGRIKEPHFMFVSVLRGLECQALPTNPWNPLDYWENWNQKIFDAPSVFGFYPPNHLSPGTLLLAPEQKMLTSEEFNFRLGSYSSQFESPNRMLAAGCQLAPFVTAASQSTTDLVALIGERFFRGLMPATVQQGLLSGVQNLWNKSDPNALTGALLGMATVTPSFGVTP